MQCWHLNLTQNRLEIVHIQLLCITLNRKISTRELEAIRSLEIGEQRNPNKKKNCGDGLKSGLTKRKSECVQHFLPIMNLMSSNFETKMNGGNLFEMVSETRINYTIDISYIIEVFLVSLLNIAGIDNSLDRNDNALNIIPFMISWCEWRQPLQSPIKKVICSRRFCMVSDNMKRNHATKMYSHTHQTHRLYYDMENDRIYDYYIRTFNQRQMHSIVLT